MTQTTPDVSFGPVFVASAQPNPLRRIFGSLQPIHDIKHLVIIKKYEKIIPMAQTKRLASFGPVFVVLPSFSLHIAFFVL
jgi:hypothetical protein